MFAAALVVALLSIDAAGAPQDVAGVVYDPHNRVIAGADVEVSCAGRSSHVLTDGDGIFAVTITSTSSTCDLTVRRSGFEPWRRAVLPSAEPITVTLAISPIKETVDVVPDPSHESWVSSSPSTARISAADLQVLGPDSRLWLDLAASAAGAFVGRRQLFVDGMPADAAPDAARIASVVVNDDPFSAEFGGVDQSRVEIDTNTPDRGWRFNAGGPTWIEGGGDALVSRKPPRSRRRFAGVSGPVPGAPLTFFVQGNTFSTTEHQTYLAAQRERVSLDVAPAARSRLSAWSVGTHANRGGFSWRAVMDALGTRLDNVGVGGLTAPAAGQQSTTVTRRFQSSWKAPHHGMTHRGGIVISRNSTDSAANSTAQAQTIFGQLNTFGSDVLFNAETATRLHVRQVVEGMTTGHPWSAGVEMSHATARQAPVPNPLGHLYKESLGAARGAWIVQRGAPSLHATTVTGAVFAQVTRVARNGVLVRAGVRGDWQAAEGLLTSPRTTIMIRGRGFMFASGAGLFVDSWSPAFLLETVKRNGIGLTTWVAPNVPASGDVLGGNIDGAIGDLLALRVAPGLARRRDIVVQTSITRQFGRIGAGIEHKWTRGVSLAGATRARTAIGLVDVIDGDRRLARQQLHARAGVSSRTISVTAHYELVHSLDDTDGAFMLPARQEDVGGEWARSTGLPGHNASLVASLAFSGAVRAFVSATAASGSPYSIVSGRDAEGLAAFADRAGAPRNAATGPAYRNVSVYASRRIPVPRAGGLAFNVGVRAENLFDATNVTSVGKVAGTTWLGQPLAALSGRSISVWLSVTR